MSHVWSEDQLSMLKKMWLGGKSREFIAKVMSVDKNAAYRKLREMGLSPKKKDNRRYYVREYQIYRGIRSRCFNKNRKCYFRYGGSGITMCDRWVNGDGFVDGYTAFILDMGYAPSSKHTVDRYPNVNGNYEPGNCRWATQLEQANNRVRTRRVTYREQEMSLTDAVRLAGSVIHYEAAAIRIRTGWSVERAVETPKLHESPNSKNRTLAHARRPERLIVNGFVSGASS